MDLVIRNARVVDGCGKVSFTADVTVKDGVIASIGKFAGSATREINANGHVLAPGVIDILSHYDPQICWDRLATPSIEKEGRRKLVKKFEKIEDINESTFDAAGSVWAANFGGKS